MKFANFFSRTQKVVVRHLLSVRSDFGHRSAEEPEDARTSLRHLQGDQLRLDRSQVHAGIPVLRQANEDRILKVRIILILIQGCTTGGQMWH